jgi:antitoxin component of RelBE/YafQ-DinJ toxin-antitoxin module
LAMERTHLLKVRLDSEDKALLDRVVAARKLSQSDTIRLLIREEHQKIEATEQPRVVNG